MDNQVPQISLASLTVDDTKFQAPQVTLPASSRTVISSQPLRLLDLPNETLLAVVARISFSRANLSNLIQANCQLKDLLNDRSNQKQLRGQMAELQYPIPNALRLNPQVDHTWASLERLKIEAEEVGQVTEWMLQYSPMPISRSDRVLLEVGLCLFNATRRSGARPMSEKESSDFLLALDPASIAVMRFVSIKARDCLRNHPFFGDDGQWQDFLMPSSSPLVIEDLLAEHGVKLLLDIPTPEFCSDTDAFKQIGYEWTMVAKYMERLTNFFKTYCMYGPRNEREQAAFHRIIAAYAGLPGPRATWSVAANDILVLDAWNEGAPSPDDLHKDADRYYREFHALSTQGREIPNLDVDDMIEDVDDEAERSRLRGMVDLNQEDWYAFVGRLLGAAIARARIRLGRGGSTAQVITAMFQTALAIRARLAVQSSGPHLAPLPPHFAFFYIRQESKALWQQGWVQDTRSRLRSLYGVGLPKFTD